MFFLLVTICIAMFIAAGVSFVSGGNILGIIFLVLGIFELVIIALIYNKERRRNSMLDCFLLDCGLDSIGSLGHMGDCDCVDLGDCDCTP